MFIFVLHPLREGSETELKLSFLLCRVNKIYSTSLERGANDDLV